MYGIMTKKMFIEKFYRFFSFEKRDHLNISHYFIVLLTAVVVIFLGWSCAYYNIFYNAQKYYQAGLKKSVANPTGTVQTQDYNKAIKTASKVLELYPESKWVDDALLLIGKSYYQIEQYRKSMRKFEELLANFPQSELTTEARLWLGKSMIAIGEVDEARQILGELAEGEKNPEIAVESRSVLSGLMFSEGEYSQAMEQYQEILARAKDKKLLAEVQYKIAECLWIQGDFRGAAKGFKAVSKFNPIKSLEFEARLRYAQSLKKAEEFPTALKVLSRLIKDEAFESYLPQVNLEIADCLLQAERREEAIQEYQKIIENYPNDKDVSAQAHYELGLIYWEIKDFQSARTHFDAVQGAKPQSEWATDSKEKITSIDRLFTLKNDITALNDTLDALQTALKASQDSVVILVLAKPVVSDSLTVDSVAVTDSVRGERVDRETVLDDVNEKQKVLFEKRFLLAEHYLHQLSDPDLAIGQLRLIGGADSAELGIKSLYLMGYIYREKLKQQAVADSLYRLILKRSPDSAYGRAVKKWLGLPGPKEPIDSALVAFLDAEHTFFNTDSFQSAIIKYLQVAESYPGSPYAAKAQYSVAWTYEKKLADYDSAVSAYRQLLKEYPHSPYAEVAQLKIARVMETLPAVTDSLRVGEGTDPVQQSDHSGEE